MLKGHTLKCSCFICKAKRRETSGKNHPRYRKRQTQEVKNKIRKAQLGKYIGEKSGMWKGDLAGICAMHHWVIQIKGYANEHKCIDCPNQARDWSNKDHQYKRNVDDYLPRCRKCHQIYDNKYNGKNI